MKGDGFVLFLLLCHYYNHLLPKCQGFVNSMKKVWLRDSRVRLLGLREEHLASQWVELSLKDAAHRIKKLT